MDDRNASLAPAPDHRAAAQDATPETLLREGLKHSHRAARDMRAEQGGGVAAGGGGSGRGRREPPIRHPLWWRIFRWLIRLLLVLLLVLLAALVWLGTESGMSTALSWTQRLLAGQGQVLAFDRVQGNLWRGGVHLGRVEWRGFDTVVKGTDLDLRWSLRSLLSGRGYVHLLSLDTLIIQLPPGDDSPRTDTDMPGDFGLPVPLEIRKVAVKRLEIQPHAQNGKDAEPYVLLKDIDGWADYELGTYRIRSLTGSTPWGDVKSAAVQMKSAPPHALKGEVQANGYAQQWPYNAKLTVDGDLARLPAVLNGTLADGLANIHAVVKPLGRMPVENLHLRLADINLLRFTALGSLPESGIDLDLDIDPVKGKAEYWQGHIKAGNRRPGTLAANRIPLRNLRSGLSFRLPSTEQWSQLHIALKDLAIGLPVSAAHAVAGPTQVSAAQPGTAATAASPAGNAVSRPETGKPVVARPAAGTAPRLLILSDKGEARIEGSLETWPEQDMTVPGVTLPRLKGDLKLTGLDLAPLWQGLPQTALGGTVKVDGQQFRVDLNQRAERMRALLPADLQKLAADAQLRLAGTLDDHWLKLSEGRAALGDSVVTVAGQASVRAPLDLKLGGTLRRLDLAQWLPADLPVDPAWRQGTLGADWSLDGRLQGPDQKANVALKLVDSQVAGQPLTGGVRAHAELDAQWQPQLLDGLELTLAHGTANRLQAKGALGRAKDVLKLDVALSRLAALDSRLAGVLNLDGQLTGRFDDLNARRSGRATDLGWLGRNEKGEPSRLGLKELKLDATAPLSLLHPDGLNDPLDLVLAAQQLTLGDQKLDAVNVGLKGSPAQHHLSVGGRMGKDRLQVRLDGALSLPRNGPVYRAMLDTVDLSGRTSVRLADPAPMVLTANQLTLDDFSLSALGGRVNLKRLLLDWTGPLKYETVGQLDGLTPLELHQLLGLDGQRELEVLQGVRSRGQWQLRGQGADALYGDIRMSIYEQASAGQKKRLGLRADNGALIRFDGRKLDGKARLDIPSIELLNLFAGPDMAFDGSLHVDGTVTGTLDSPLVDLALRGNELSVLQRSAGMRLSGGTLDARLDSQGLRLKQLRFSAGKGSLLLQGAARLVDRGDPKQAEARQKTAWAALMEQSVKNVGKPPSLLPMEGAFDVTLDHFLVPVGPGQRVTISGATRLTSNHVGLILAGDMAVDEGLIELQGSSAPTLPNDVKVTGEQIPQDQPETAGTEQSLRIASDLVVKMGDKLKINGMGVEARLGGSVQVRGFLPAEPALVGLVKIAEGSYQAYGQNLQFTKGRIRFNGPVDNPSLDMEAKRPFVPVDVGLSITGTAQNPQVALYSRPSMSENDKLSWLVLGVPAEEAGGGAQALALQQAGSLLLGGNDGVRGPSIAERLGLDVLNYGYASDASAQAGVQNTMTPKGVASGSSTDSSAAETGVVSLGKRINDRLFVSYEKGVRGVWNLLRIQYTLGKGYVVRAQSGTENSLDILRSRTFD